MDINLTFMGAAGNVTGSRYLIETDDLKLLVDCGLYQERDFLERNWEPFRCSPAELHAVLLTHAHLDHSGLLPKLASQGFHGRVICTAATADITKIMLIDSAHLQEEDAAFKKKRHLREGRRGPFPEIPLYTVADAEASLGLFDPVAYNTPVAVADGIEATFHDAGHVLGSSVIKLVFNRDGDKRSIVFSGDIGRWDRPYLHDPDAFRRTDYLVMESTYGDREHKGTDTIADDLADVVRAAFAAGGNIIVPSFALERSQEILYYLNNLLIAKRIPPIDVYLDSPMAIKITEVFKQYAAQLDDEMRELVRRHQSPLDFPGLKMVETVEESKKLNDIRGTVMIIAGSGMCTGGRIKHHLVNNISRPECTVLFVGYQARGTLGRQILDGARSVRIHGQSRPVRAKIAHIPGFSAHADRDELLRWLSLLSAGPRLVFLTHGEAESAASLKTSIEEKTGYKVAIPSYGERFRLV